MEKTIRELATELNISKEAIYRKINHSMKGELEKHVAKNGGKTFISAVGQSIICQSLKRENDETERDQEQILTEGATVSNQVNNQNAEVNNLVTNDKSDLNAEYIKHLEKQLDLLQTRYDEEVSNNRRERETLYQLNQSLIDTFNKEQHLKIAEKTLEIQEKQALYQEHKNGTAEVESPQRGFLSRIFGKK